MVSVVGFLKEFFLNFIYLGKIFKGEGGGSLPTKSFGALLEDLVMLGLSKGEGPFQAIWM